jgi:hypothetical protein
MQVRCLLVTLLLLQGCAVKYRNCENTLGIVVCKDKKDNNTLVLDACRYKWDTISELLACSDDIRKKLNKSKGVWKQ